MIRDVVLHAAGASIITCSTRSSTLLLRCLQRQFKTGQDGCDDDEGSVNFRGKARRAGREEKPTSRPRSRASSLLKSSHHPMCGIFCSLSRHRQVEPTASVKKLLLARGPDALNQVTIECAGQESQSTTFITCCSTVLSLRGFVTVAQPLQDQDSQSTLCWNGEAWSIEGVRPVGNDTTSVLELLTRSTSSDKGPVTTQAVPSALSQIAGPYAFVFVDASRSTVYFGRDFLGRRSLLCKVDADGSLLFSSVTDGPSGQGWSEVEADGIYSIDLTLQPISEASNVEKWGEFSVKRTEYAYVNASDDKNNSVGRLSQPRVHCIAHGKVGHSRALIESRAVLHNHVHERAFTASSATGTFAQRSSWNQDAGHSGPACTLRASTHATRSPPGSPVLRWTRLHDHRKALPRSPAVVRAH